MSDKEAKARIKINKLLEEAGWRFLDSAEGRANILLENNVKITKRVLDEYGNDFEKTKNGFVDFLLLDSKGFPSIVLEAKAEKYHPLSAKEQAREYAESQNCRFVILSNGNAHYLWDIERGNPHAISTFPTQEMTRQYSSFKPDPQSIIDEAVEHDYIVLTQKPDYKTDASWIQESSRGAFIEQNKLRFLRPYQVRAIRSIQVAVKKGKDRFLFEMATGTGKTLIAAAVIKLFLRTGNVRRVLFLVDRLELEDQAKKNFVIYLKNDCTTVIYKERRDDWRKAEVVVSTIQTFMANNRYKREFSPADFDLVISDEAHRSIGGNSRAVFEYFMGYKLGLTATPRDYLKNIDREDLRRNDPRELERRILLDTYKTFGCENGNPTFRYSLSDGVKEGFLRSPITVDARTDITTQLLSDKGYAVIIKTEEGKEDEATYVGRDFEKNFFSEATNSVFCKTLLDHGLRDPLSGEFGKTIVFCVSQNHAAKIANLLNIMAHEQYPGKYKSDFAMQVTSSVQGAQQYAINFSDNKLSGSGAFDPSYITSKTRICVTVGMMTTGYDCQDILNIALMRPIFSPTDFIQIKGRGTRTYDFSRDINDDDKKRAVRKLDKEKYEKRHFKLFDYFANCEYFEEKYNYDEVVPLPKLGAQEGGGEGGPLPPPDPGYENLSPDTLASKLETVIGPEGMKIDRMYFEKFEERVKTDPVVAEKLAAASWEALIDHIEHAILNKPEEFFTLEKLRAAFNIDRRITMREIIEKIFGMIPYFKTRDELLDEEFDKFDSRFMPDERYFDYAKTVFKAYVLDAEFRGLIDEGKYSMLNVHPCYEAFKNLSPELRRQIPEHVKDFVSFNTFAA